VAARSLAKLDRRALRALGRAGTLAADRVVFVAK
jgi:hypothetical protein